MQPDSEGFLRPRVDEARCVSCGLCQKACPILHPPLRPDRDPRILAVINKNDRDRDRAASGGVFILLARNVLKEGGVVFGAAFQPDFSVAHEAAETEEAVLRFCGPKYSQSRIGTTYPQAKTLLEQGRPVLFSGTPCQIAGLRSFLKKDYPQLLTVDIICHGVPSPGVWQRYVQERTRKDGGTAPDQISFRSKRNGWSGYEMVFRYPDREYRVHHRQDPFLRGFLRELYLRPSCYQCAAKGIRRPSDITLGDLWGCRALCPELFDDKGTSLVLVHSEKGCAVWDALGDQIRVMPVTEEAFRYNPATIRSMVPHPNRALFFQRAHHCADLSALIMELTPDPVVEPPSLYRSIRGKLGRMLRSLCRSRQ
jgi:coenzyme F420-reducing hydrogenase beta subunit